MNALLCMTARNLKIFLKDKANIFFSLLAPLIVLALYVLFLGRVQADGINESLAAAGVTGAEQSVQAFCDAWMLVGTLASSCITVPLCACGLIVQDKKRGIVKDFAASAVSGWVAPLSYFFSVIAAGLVLCFAVFLLGLGWLALSGSWYLTVADIFGAIGVLILSVVCSSALCVFIAGFLRSEGAFMGLNVIFGTVVGFLIGAYMPVSMFPAGIRYFTALIPGSYSAGLFRNLLMGGALDSLAEIAPAEAVDSLAEQFSFHIDFFGREVVPSAMALVLAGMALLFIAVMVLFGFVFPEQRKKPKKNL